MTTTPDRPAGLERLQHGSHVAEVAPAIGGSLATFCREEQPGGLRRHWLRPAGADALRAGSPLGMASFPLVPWCNRIRDGRFEWRGRQIRLPPNADGSPHTMHGIGWRRPWAVTARSADAIELVLREAGDGAWPFPFVAVQRYQLDSRGLSISLSLRNTGDEPMPAGIGHHPYFPHVRGGAGTQVQADVAAIWLSDRDLLPTALSTEHPTIAALRDGMLLDAYDLDNNFTGFGHRARVSWPDGSGLVLDAQPPLDYFVLYTPAAEDFFVMEAVSNCTDWVNQRSRSVADVGGMALAPGATLQAVTRFTPEA